MTDADPGLSGSPMRPGERLRAAREAQGLSLGDVAARTRIPLRHLESIEGGAYSNLPSQTYAMGFVRAYARAIGADEVALAADVRRELGRNWTRPVNSVPAYQVEDPARTPPRGLVWGGVLVAVLLIVALGLWYGTDLFRGGSGSPASLAVPGGGVAVPVPAMVAPAPATAAGDQVVLTATDEVWVRVYDGSDTTLVMKTMAPGERFVVPAGASDPQINVGRPDKLAITVGGRPVAALGDGRVPIKDVSLSPASLLARGTASPAAKPTTAAATPAPTRRASSPAARPSPRATAAAPAPTPVPTPASPAPVAPAAPATGNTTGA